MSLLSVILIRSIKLFLERMTERNEVPVLTPRFSRWCVCLFAVCVTVVSILVKLCRHVKNNSEIYWSVLLDLSTYVPVKKDGEKIDNTVKLSTFLNFQDKALFWWSKLSAIFTQRLVFSWKPPESLQGHQIDFYFLWLITLGSLV